MMPLDTSGIVPRCAPTTDPRILGPIGWHDLNPFVQAYVEAAINSLSGDFVGVWTPDRGPRFSDLAPETLAGMLKDCEDFRLLAPRWISHGGAFFWCERQADRAPGFPPLRVTLGDDGRIYLEPAS
jgi:hypothetical protein